MSKEKQKNPAPSKPASAVQDKSIFVFEKENYKLMLIGIAVVALGMLLMIGGASDDPKKFSEDIFNFRRLTLAPIVIIAGYVVVLLAIIKKPKNTE